MNKAINLFSVIFLSVTFLHACNKSSGAKSTPHPISEDKLETDMYGNYQGFLKPLNMKVAGRVTGSLTLLRERDDLVAHLRFSGGPASILHTQNLHVGSRCPNKNDDLNGDGFIDADEGEKVYQEIIIPLDGDLNSQRMGGGTFPLADEFGNYSYTQVADWSKFIADLHDEDINTDDDFVKIGSEKRMLAEGKVVVVLGVPEDASLPSSVVGRGYLDPHEALPIACGVLHKLTKTPGTIDHDHTGIPVPEGETIGGSGGSDDGAIFDHGTTAGGSTGNYGDEDESSTPPPVTETTGGSV